jgi:hypothetical protein
LHAFIFLKAFWKFEFVWGLLLPKFFYLSLREFSSHAGSFFYELIVLVYWAPRGGGIDLGLHVFLYISQGQPGTDSVVGDPPEGVLVMIRTIWWCGLIIDCQCSGPITSPGRHGDGFGGVVGLDLVVARCARIHHMTMSLISLGSGSFVSGGGEFWGVDEKENAGGAECH